MYSIINTAIIKGIDSIPIHVESDISNGLPMFEMVGYLSAEVKEAKERVKIALKNSGFILPHKRITINITPANIKKSGTGFDLPVALGLLCAMEEIPQERLNNACVVGEIGLNGDILPVRGILSMAAMSKEMGYNTIMVPKDNAMEASLVKGLDVIPLSSLNETVQILTGRINIPVYKYEESTETADDYLLDFKDVHGQNAVKRACEISVSGMHNLLMIGPPGSGKSMIAQRIPTILPPLTKKEQMELSKIYSVSGMLDASKGLTTKRPCRMPHHTITPQALSGGGTYAKPGEISLSHGGVLFLDELPEFNKNTLEILRQPMEEKCIHLVRMNGTYTYPANFLFVAAMNPCKCGFYPDFNKCNCSARSIKNYLSGISQPLLDRIEICIEAPRISFEDLMGTKGEETSAEIRERVIKVHNIQRERYKYEDFLFNSQIPSSKIDTYCPLSSEHKEYLKEIFKKLDLSARSYFKILKVARTIADLEGSDNIKMSHLSEAICYRSADKKYWEGGEYEV